MIRINRKIAIGILVPTLFVAGCSQRSTIDGVVKGFFHEVNQSNFESAKSKYLSTAYINTLNSPLMMTEGHKEIQKSFADWVGNIKSVDVTNEQITGEQASVTVVLLMPWGTKVSGTVELVKQGGNDWKIAEWKDFKALGYDRMRDAVSLCNPRSIDTAVEDLNAALAENPADAMILTAFGGCYEQAGNLPAAEEKLRQATAMYPDIVWTPYIGLGDVYSKEGKPSEAEVALMRAIKNKPDDASSNNALAWFYAEHDMKPDQAVELAQKANSLAPNNAEVLDTLGWAFYKKGDRDQARKYLAQAVGKAPYNQQIQAHYREVSTTAATHIARAQALLKQHQFDEALSECDAALRLEPENTSAQSVKHTVIDAAAEKHLQEAQSLFAQQKYDNALSECELALRFDPQNAQALSLKTRVTETKKALGYN